MKFSTGYVFIFHNINKGYQGIVVVGFEFEQLGHCNSFEKEHSLFKKGPYNISGPKIFSSFPMKSNDFMDPYHLI